MKRILGIALILTLGIGQVTAQTNSTKPKLVIGIVVDQMRQDYLYKYADRYGEGGFKRLMSGGFMMKNGQKIRH